MTIDAQIETTKRVFTDPHTGHEIWQMTQSDQASFHSYYDLCPWNGDGTRLVFSRLPLGSSQGHIHWLDLETGELHLVGAAAGMDPHQGAMQQWLGTSNRVAYLDTGKQGTTICVVDVDNGETLRLDGPLRMVSPDGRWAAGHTHIHDEAALVRRDSEGLFVAPLGEGAPRLIVSLAQALDRNPRRGEIDDRHLYIKHAKWTPQGDRLFFVFTNELHFERKYGEARVKDIYAVRPDGSDLRYVCQFEMGHHPSWHPDGRHILLNRRPRADAPFQFLLVDADTGAAQVATDLIEGSGHPTFSPDGKRILVEYVTGLQGEGRVTVIDLERQTVADISRFPVIDHSHQGTHIHPVWSRDGRFILFNSDQSGHAEMYIAPIAS